MSEMVHATIEFPEWVLNIPEAKKTIFEYFGDEEEWISCYHAERDGRTIWLSDYATRDGEFSKVEECFRKIGIPYNRWTDACYGEEPYILKYRPDLDKDVCYDESVPIYVLENIVDSPNLKEEIEKLLPPKFKELWEYDKPIKAKNTEKSSSR